MLAGEAIRLVAVEILRPTSAVLAGTGFPTLAGQFVYDSRGVAIQDLSPDASYTPVLSLFTAEGGVRLRGAAAAADDTEADCVLDVVGELAVIATDGAEVEAAAATDPTARLQLMAMMDQVRHMLTRSQAGVPFRRLVRQVTRIEYETFAVPNLGMRWQSVLMRLHCSIVDVTFDMDNGGLPQPIKAVYEALPAGSYAKAKLAELSAAFAGETLIPLEDVAGVTTPSGVEFGQSF